MNKPEFTVSVDTTLIEKALAEVAVGERITYEEIEKICGRPITNLRGSIATALHLVQRNKQIVFGSIRTVGYVRLSDFEIVDTYDKTRTRISRESRRAAKRIVCVDYDALSKEKKVKHNAALSMLGAISNLASVGSVKRIENAITECGTSLPAAKTAIAALGI